MKKLTDLRNRPFLIVNTITRPAKGVQTNRKGWANDRNNWALFEIPSIVDRVSARHMREATIIIDVMSGDCVKNRFSEVADSEVAEHYLGKYRTEVAEAMDVWLTRMTRRIAADPTLNPTETVAALRAQAQKLAGTSDATAGTISSTEA